MPQSRAAYRQAVQKSTLPVAALVGLLLVALLGSLLLIAAYQTRLGQTSESRLASDVLHERGRNLERIAAGYGVRKDVLSHFDGSVDTLWASENLGNAVLRIFDFDMIFVVDPDNHTSYAMADGSLSDRMVESVFDHGFESLLAQVRRNPAGSGVWSVVSADGAATMVAMVPIRPLSSSDDSVPPVLIFAERVNTALFRTVAGPGFLHSLAVTNRQPTGHAWIRLTAHDGEALGFVTWKGMRPGDALLRVALPIWLVLALVFGGLTTWILRKAHETVSLLDESDHSARHDILTGLANRLSLHERLQQACDEIESGAPGFALFYVDLDGFKDINDRWGHDAGDAVLKAVAERLRFRCEPWEFAARLGGDEFVVLAVGDQRLAAIRNRADKLIEAIRQPIDFERMTLHVGATVGIAVAPLDGADPMSLLRHADGALYDGKRAGKGQACFRPSSHLQAAE